VSAEEPVTKSRPEPSPTSRDRARPVAKAQVASPGPVRALIATPAPKVEAKAATTWVLGNSKDEQNVLPESETVRRERDQTIFPARHLSARAPDQHLLNRIAMMSSGHEPTSVLQERAWQ